MLTKNEIKYLKSLHQKKERELAKCFLCEGDKIVKEVISSDWKIKNVYVTHKTADNLNLNANFQLVSEKEIEQFSGLSNPPGIIALVEYPENLMPSLTELKGQTFLVLDGINDPGNLGTIIRLADWYDIKYIFCSENTVECYNSKVVQATMGSIFRTKVFYIDLNAFLKECIQEHIPLFAAVMDGNSAEKGFMTYGGLIMGSESHGISSDLLLPELKRITIPKFGKAESLNVGVATGILLSMIR